MICLRSISLVLVSLFFVGGLSGAATPAASKPALSGFFQEGPLAYGLSPDGTWYAFAVRQGGESFIYTRSPSRDRGYKITGLSGEVDQLIWLADAQFALRARQGEGARISLTDPSGRISWDFTPPGYSTVSIVANQPSPHRTGKLFFLGRRAQSAHDDLLALTVPRDGVTATFETDVVLANSLDIQEWLFSPAGEILGGTITRGGTSTLCVAGENKKDQSTWTEVYSSRADFFPSFSGYGCPQGALLAQGYFQGNFSSAVLFDLKTRQFGEAIVPPADANIEQTVFTPDLGGVAGYVVNGELKEARSQRDTFRRFRKFLDRKTTIRHGIPIATGPTFEQTLVLEQDERTAPKYWYVDLVRNEAILVIDLGETLGGIHASPMKPLALKSRDNLSLPCFWTEPERNDGNSPLVILVPGGPFEGVHRTWSGLIQALASRGATVLTVNYRGGRGFGRAFYEAGLGRAGSEMVDDVRDVLRAVRTSGTRWSKVLLLGISYGGYLSVRALQDGTEGVDHLALLNPLIDPTDFFRRGEVDTGGPAVAEFEKQRWIGSAALSTLPALTELPAPRVPVLLIQSAQDERVPREIAERYASYLRSGPIEVSGISLDDRHALNHPESWQRATAELLKLIE